MYMYTHVYIYIYIYTYIHACKLTRVVAKKSPLRHKKNPTKKPYATRKEPYIPKKTIFNFCHARSWWGNTRSGGVKNKI